MLPSSGSPTSACSSLAIGLGFIIAIVCGAPVRADFEFPNFTNTDGLTLVGDANQSGTVIVLTPALPNRAGAVWYTAQQNIRLGFSTTFEIQFASTSGGADGIAFVVQGDDPEAIGLHGSALGYGGDPALPSTGIADSLAVEFDDFQNPGLSDPSGNHVSVHTLYNWPNSADESASIGATSSIPSLAGIHLIRIEYFPGQLLIFVDDLSMPDLIVPIDLTEVTSSSYAWIGFTSATGSLFEAHNLRNWSFEIGGQRFVRGDGNGDGMMDVSDPVYLLAALFIPGTAEPVCSDAADVNDDGVFDISDPVYALASLFIPGSAPPPPPSGKCGRDPSEDKLGCGGYEGCP